MIVYWAMFAIPALFALFEQRRDRGSLNPLWVLFALLLAVLIGFRWKTGGDWDNYNAMVEDELLAPSHLGPLSDPGFGILLRIAARSSLGILLITTTSGLMMGFALTRFCLRQPRPWLAMAVAVPYLVVVMGMGYVRQGMAISCWMMAMVAVENGKSSRYPLWVLLGSVFHSTSIVMLPLGPMAVTRNLVARVALGLLALILLAYGLASARGEMLVTNYVGAEMSSSGTAVRLLMTAIPGTLFLAYRSRFGLDRIEQQIWSLIAYAGILGLLAIMVSPSSTVVDRLGLYLLPIQSFVYSRLPEVLSPVRRQQRLYVVLILALYVVSFFVWLNFAVNSWAWQPYRFYWLEDAACLEC